MSSFECFVYMQQGLIVVGNKHEQAGTSGFHVEPNCSSGVAYTTRNLVMIYALDNMEFHEIYSGLCRRSENTADPPASQPESVRRKDANKACHA
jgi:hypothetical protein